MPQDLFYHYSNYRFNPCIRIVFLLLYCHCDSLSYVQIFKNVLKLFVTCLIHVEFSVDMKSALQINPRGVSAVTKQFAFV